MHRTTLRQAPWLLGCLLGLIGMACQLSTTAPGPRGGTVSRPPASKELGEPRQPLLTLKGSYRLAFARSAPALASADNGRLRVWELPAGKERAAIDLGGKDVSCLALSPDGKVAAAALV